MQGATEGSFRNRRRYPRVSLPNGMPVSWNGAGLQLFSRVKTLGMGGLFITAPNPPPVGAKLRLAFEVPGGNVRVDAIVRNIAPAEGFGVEFTGMAVGDKILLQNLMSRLLPVVGSERDTVFPRPMVVPKRLYARYPFSASGTVSDESGVEITAQVTTIGAGGCGLITSARFSVGTRVSVRIRKDKDYFETLANVAYCAEDSLGLMFHGESTASLRVLLKWLQHAKKSIAAISDENQTQR